MFRAKIRITPVGKSSKDLSAFLKKVANETLRRLKKNNRQIEILLLSGGQMAALNRRFRGRNKTTTVLSFPASAQFIYPQNGFRNIGEIYLDPDLIKKISGTGKRQVFKIVLSRFLIHGLLHLLGYTHNRARDRIKMEKKEKWLMSLLA